MKVVVIGNGEVGKAGFRELQDLSGTSEPVIVGRETEVCRAEAEDHPDALPMRIDHPGKIYGGGYEPAERADIPVYCAGPSITAEDRMSVANKFIKSVGIVREACRQSGLIG